MQDVSNIASMLIFFAAVVAILVLFGIAIRMCWKDARQRGKLPFLVCAIVIFFFPLGLIAWLLFRPETLENLDRPQEFRLENHRLQ